MTGKTFGTWYGGTLYTKRKALAVATGWLLLAFVGIVLAGVLAFRGEWIPAVIVWLITLICSRGAAPYTAMYDAIRDAERGGSW